MERPVLILDVGGGTLRLGLAHEDVPREEPNCAAQGGKHLLFGRDVLSLPSCRLLRPSRRGLLLDSERQQRIWAAALARQDLGGLRPGDCAVLAVLAPLTPLEVQEEVVAILEEDLGFAEVSCIESSCVALKSPGVSAQLLACSPSPCCTVLGLGFSASFAQPCVEGKAIASAGRRSCVGGRILTNLLMESLKLRHLDLSKAWLTVEDIFTKTCRVATDIRLEEGEPVNYVLPDFQERLQGFVAAEVPEGAQSITLTRERCVIPEALFRPQDHGIPAAGLAELVHQAILAVPEMLRPHLGRVVLCGGLARLPNLPRRLRAELRRLLPSHWPVEILLEDHPELSVWRGAAQHALHAGHSEAAAATPGVSGASPSARRGRGRGKGAVSRAGSAKMPSGKSPAQRKRPPSTISADVEAEEDAAALPTGAVSLGEPESTPAPRLKRISRKMSVEGKSAA
ncbi:unnamed protein product [Effrenium voratum]|nr:unnamed protein product [Effrenium voratum]